MFRRFCALVLVIAAVFGCLVASGDAFGQSFGVELHNTLTPASGAMAGASVARPLDVTAAINGNPASLTQFHGTQFQFSGAWAEPTLNVQHAGGVLPNVGAFSAKSAAQGSALGNIGVTQDFSALGLPATVGLGFITSAGAVTDFISVPASNGTSTGLFLFDFVIGGGVDVSERLSAGAAVKLGIGMFDAPFVGISSMTLDYALRGSVGATYELTPCTTLGAYFETKQPYTFDDAIRLDLGAGFDIVRDVGMDLPPNIAVGISNDRLMNGCLLVSVDVLYKLWDEASLFDEIYDNQLVIQTGAQYSMGKYRLRGGYAWAENPLQSPPGTSAGGITPPGAVAALEYVQSQLAVTSQHRITAGIGIVDVLPGLDFDLLAGGMLHDSAQLGAFTSTSIESYWLGAGFTWRFGRGACEYGDWCCE